MSTSPRKMPGDPKPELPKRPETILDSLERQRQPKRVAQLRAVQVAAQRHLSPQKRHGR